LAHACLAHACLAHAGPASISNREPAILAPPLIGAKQGEIKENVDVAALLPYLRPRGAGVDAIGSIRMQPRSEAVF